MELVEDKELLAKYCRMYNKYGIFFSFEKEGDYEVVQEYLWENFPALKKLSLMQIMEVIDQKRGYLIFDSEEEQYNAFESIKDDSIFALTISNKGVFESTNT